MGDKLLELLEKLDARMERVENSQKETVEGFRKLASNQDGIIERLERLEKGQERNTELVGELSSRIGKLEGRIDGTEGRMSNIEGCMYGIENRLSNFESRMDGFEKIQLRIETKIDDIKAVAVEKQMVFEDELKLIKKDIIFIKGALEHFSFVALEKRLAELEERVRDIEKKVG